MEPTVVAVVMVDGRSVPSVLTVEVVTPVLLVLVVVFTMVVSLAEGGFVAL